MNFIELRVKKNTHDSWGLARRAACCKRGIQDRETAMPTQRDRSETDTTQRPQPAHPEGQPEPGQREPAGPLVPRDTQPGKPEQQEPPVENV